MPPLRLAPSMMCAEFLRLGEELATLAAGGADWLHQDVMDGRYVPNLALGPDACRAMARACPLAQDIHLMVEEPERHVHLFAGLPGARLAFHPEATRHPAAVVAQIRASGAVPGIALSPSISVATVRYLLPLVEQVTVMTVNPGFAGQKLLPWCLPKIAELRAWADDHQPDLEIAADGNVSWEHIPAMLAAGANALVLGTSSLFQAGQDRLGALGRLRAAASAKAIA